MKRPNGNGSIVKLSGKRRKKFLVRVTQGWNDDGTQNRIFLGTYKTQAEANKTLADYLINPYDLEISKITFKEIFDKWSSSKFNKITNSGITGYNAAFTAFKEIHNINFQNLKTTHLQTILDKSDKGYSTKKRMKTLLNQMYSYAIQNDIISKNYSNYLDIGKNKKKSERTHFTNEEIETLWKYHKKNEWIDTILIMIYTGFRIGELLTIENKNINFENSTIRGGIKTDAGKNRLVPIHRDILPLIKARYVVNKKFFISNHKGKQMTYDNYYRDKFQPIMKSLEMKHRPHDCRHTFATLLNNANANKTAITQLIGHNNYTSVEKIYTHKETENLRKNIELINI